MIEIKNVTKTFVTPKQNVHACNDISLTIEEGEIYGIIGFSGAGKSTLVRCINLLERPTSGQVLIDGAELTVMSETELRKVRKKIGMIFQHFNLMRSRTVAQNIAYPLKGSGLSNEEIQAKVKSLLKLVELEDKENAYPSQLSGGQKQRVAIARALANDPKVLLCDEATSALDPQTTHSILALLKEVNQKLGITIVLITHEMAVIKAICDRVAVMEKGHVVEEGKILDVFSHPKQEVTKNFIRSTSSVSQIYEMVEKNDPLVAIKENESLIILSYSAGNAGEALISAISRKFNVDANIVFGNVEIIANQAMGSLVVIISGELSDINQAVAYIRDAGVKVEVLKTC